MSNLRTLDSFWKPKKSKPAQGEASSPPQASDAVEVINVENDTSIPSNPNIDTGFFLETTTLGNPVDQPVSQLNDSPSLIKGVKQENRRLLDLKSFLIGRNPEIKDKAKGRKSRQRKKLKSGTDSAQSSQPIDLDESIEIVDVSHTHSASSLNQGKKPEETRQDLNNSVDIVSTESSLEAAQNMTASESNFFEMDNTDAKILNTSKIDSSFVDPSFYGQSADNGELDFIDPCLSTQLIDDSQSQLLDPEILNLSNIASDPPQLSELSSFISTGTPMLTENLETQQTNTTHTNGFARKPVSSLSSLLSGAPKKIKRLNKVSMVKSLPCPVFPSAQHIKVPVVFKEQQSYLQNLPKVKKLFNLSRVSFPPEDYNFLSNNNTEQENTKVTRTWNVPPIHTIKQWDVHFKPDSFDDLLLDKDLKKEFQLHLMDSFQKLSRQTTRHKLKSYKKLLQINEFKEEMADFIVPDYTEDEAFTNGNTDGVEEFVPIMILYGDAVGKNCLISTCLQEMDVFEINTSMPRGKRQIMDMCMEVVTTQFVNKSDKVNGESSNVINNNTTPKRNGVVLFDDVDVLFKEADKNFWLVVNKLLEVSRRPIILTCKNLTCIPKNILGICELENGIFELNKPSFKTCQTFLSKKLGTDFPSDLIETVLVNNKCDLRQSLLQLQYISLHEKFTVEQSKQNATGLTSNTENFDEICKHFDLVSSCDVIKTGVQYSSSIKPDIDLTLRDEAFNTENGVFSSSGFGNGTNSVQTLSDSTLANSKKQRNGLNLLNFSSVKENYEMDEETSSKLRTDCLVSFIPHYLDTQTLHTLQLFEKDYWMQFFQALHVNGTAFEKPGSNEVPIPHDFDACCDFLASQISNRYEAKRQTRNKRKYKEILSNLNNELEDDTLESECKRQVLIDSSGMKNINQYFVPTIQLLARNDKLLRQHNMKTLFELRSVYENYTDEEILRYMERENLLKRIWFSKDPSKTGVFM
ncbi:hypothetical protein ACO0QE_004608 [Hanseniaspora vineae]